LKTNEELQDHIDIQDLTWSTQQVLNKMKTLNVVL
jgi:hypothetical protein